MADNNHSRTSNWGNSNHCEDQSPDYYGPCKEYSSSTAQSTVRYEESNRVTSFHQYGPAARYDTRTQSTVCDDDLDRDSSFDYYGPAARYDTRTQSTVV